MSREEGECCAMGLRMSPPERDCRLRRLAEVMVAENKNRKKKHPGGVDRERVDGERKRMGGRRKECRTLIDLTFIRLLWVRLHLLRVRLQNTIHFHRLLSTSIS